MVVATVGKPTLQPYIGGGGKLRSLFLVTPGPNMAVDEVFCCGWVVGKAGGRWVVVGLPVRCGRGFVGVCGWWLGKGAEM